MNRRNLTPLALLRRPRPALLLLLALTACEKPLTPPPPAAQQVLPMEAPEATQMARTLANQQALALYRCRALRQRPFRRLDQRALALARPPGTGRG